MANRVWKSGFVFCAAGVFSISLLAASPGRFPNASSKPELSLKDLNGKRVRLRDLQGNIVVLNFWATWCVPCNAEFPLLVDAQKTYSSRGVVFIGASLDDDKTKKNIPAFLHKFQADFSVWTGASAGDLDRLQMGPAVPATAFLDQQGHIVARVEGQLRPGEIDERLDWLLAGKSGPAPEALVVHLDKK